MKFLLIAAAVVAASFMGAAPAHADECRTDYMSNASYTYCNWTDIYGYPHRTVTTCIAGTPQCSTREM